MTGIGRHKMLPISLRVSLLIGFLPFQSPPTIYSLDLIGCGAIHATLKVPQGSSQRCAGLHLIVGSQSLGSRK